MSIEIQPIQRRKLSVRILFRLRALLKKLNGNGRIAYNRALGASIGNGVRLGYVTMPVPEQVYIGDNCEIEDHVRLRVGGKWKNGSIRIEDNTFIGHSTQINIGGQFKVGKNCLIAPMCVFSDAHHHFADPYVPIKEQSCDYSSIEVEDNVWIGTGAIILGGVTIHSGAVIAAGAVVTQSIPGYEVWGGVPAKKIKSRTENSVSK